MRMRATRYCSSDRSAIDDGDGEDTGLTQASSPASFCDLHDAYDKSSRQLCLDA
jgi:hypothetical protein